MESKKLKMVLAGIAGTLLVLLIKGLFPDLPDGVVEWAIGVVGGVPALGATGQAIADGMTKGLTSSQGAAIRENQREMQGLPSPPPVTKN
jgi:hypothetical protein